jgi:hypothetical protein
MVTLFLSTAAMVLLTAVGCGAMLCAAASTEEPPADELPLLPERTSFPDTLDRQGPLASLDRGGPRG